MKQVKKIDHFAKLRTDGRAYVAAACISQCGNVICHSVRRVLFEFQFNLFFAFTFVEICVLCGFFDKRASAIDKTSKTSQLNAGGRRRRRRQRRNMPRHSIIMVIRCYARDVMPKHLVELAARCSGGNAQSIYQ